MFVLAALSAGLLGCSGETLNGVQLDADSPARDATAIEAAVAAKDGAWVIGMVKDDCLLPAVAPDGSVYPVFGATCSVRFAVTSNERGSAVVLFSGTVPNESGRAVQVTIDTPPGIPCFYENVDPPYSGSTTDYLFNISASGQFRGVCHVPD
jgi:hypothetical protein